MRAFQVTRIPQRHLPEVLVRVTRASSIRRRLSVHTQSPEGIEHGIVNGPTTFASAPTGSSAPDSITMENGSFFVEYGNGADSTGAGGSSTIVQYDKAGNIEHSYSTP